LFPHLAAHPLWWLAVGGAGMAARYVRLRARSFRLVEFEEYVATSDLLYQQAAFGYNAHSLVSISPGARLWSCPQLDGAITYNEFGKVWLVPGDPLAQPDDVAELTRRFVGAAQAERRFAAFMPATARFARQAAPVGLHAVKIGAAPYFDLTTWGPRGDRAKKARAGVNQARRAGVRVVAVSSVDEPLRRETALLCRSWLKARRCAVKLGWLFELDPFHHAERKKFFTARDATGKLVGFLAASPIPARDGWYLEDVLRLPSAPSGTADLLVVEALNLLKLDGARLATLGTSPLAREGDHDPLLCNHESIENILRIITSCFSRLYNFEGLHRFKTKFAPSWWESEYVLLPRQLLAPPHIIRAFIQAVTPDGPSNVIARQIARAIKRPEPEFKLAPQVETRTAPSNLANRDSLITNRVNMNKEQISRQLNRESYIESEEAEPALRPYFGQFVSVNGLRLHFVSKGTGRPVVFVHGNPGSHQDFSRTLFGHLSEGYRALAFDRPGHGQSERPNHPQVTVEVQARLVRDALKQLSIAKPIIVGHSWGAAVALAMALNGQEELAGLVLLAPAAYPSDTAEWWTLLPQLPFVGSFFMKTMTPLLGRHIVRNSLKEAYHPQPVQEDYARAAETLWTRHDQIRACASDDRTLDVSLEVLSERYPDLRLPVVIVTGDTDLLVEPAEHAHRLHRSISGSKLICLESVGHQIPQTQPESVVAAIDMIESLDTRL
jgi:pimeloyl-ACP methyl ester carboxylesterase